MRHHKKKPIQQHKLTTTIQMV